MNKDKDLIKFKNMLISNRMKVSWDSLSEWVESGVCSKKEMNKFIEIINSVEDSVLKELISCEYGVISYIKKPSHEIARFVLLELQKTGSVFRYYDLAVHYEDLSLIALQKDEYGLSRIKNQTVDLYLFALKQRKDNFEYVRIVPNPDFKTTLANLKKKQVILEALND